MFLLYQKQTNEWSAALRAFRNTKIGHLPVELQIVKSIKKYILARKNKNLSGIPLDVIAKHSQSNSHVNNTVLWILYTTGENMSFYMYFKGKKWANSISTDKF